MLTKELLRVSRRGDYTLQLVDESHEPLAARVIGVYQGHVDKRRETLQAALTELERESDDFKLVRGFAKLVERDADWTVRAPVKPRRARRAAFEAAEQTGVVTSADRRQALAAAAEMLETTASALETSLYADLENRQILTTVDPRWQPAELCEQYNLSLAQTALFDATELRVRSSDPKRVVSASSRLGLLYSVRRLPPEDRRTVADADRELVVTGPDSVFRATRRYGTQFARLLRTVAATNSWRLTATVDDRGTDRSLVLTQDEISVPDVEPVTEVRYDSAVERTFARRFEAVDLDWELVREPDAVAAGEHVIIPDFAFDWQYSEFRVYFEIMGFWTPEYVQTKLDRLSAVEDVELLVAVDESLGVGEAVEARDHRVISYMDQVPIKSVRGALRKYEDQLVADSAASLPAALTPADDSCSFATLATRHGVSEAALADKSFPDHERVGRMLVRPSLLATLEQALEPGMKFETAAEQLASVGIDDTSAVLARLGYRVAWDGLSGGTLRDRDSGTTAGSK
ncbi:MAG: hypothetical protein J07HX5_01259 [halophilic archaeon J07HX5]|nr:MAG: hypothetical protein J07HX5_01259 [halophilic archaeon J07HX5]